MGSVSLLMITYLVNATEILNGVKFSLGIYLSREESHLLTDYLDKDGDS